MLVKSDTQSQSASSNHIESWKWGVMALIGAAFFVIVLDFSVVNVALPSIQRSLGFTPLNLMWISSAFAIVFGGFLLLGGRCADLLGRREVLLAGVGIFTVASLIAGLSELAGGHAREVLIASRALQGLGSAFIGPAALAILNTTFDEGAQRNRAMGIFGSIATAGFASGNLLGGVLTGHFGWQSIFYVNVPLGILLLVLAPRLVPRSASEDRPRLNLNTLDVGGAFTVTSGLTALIYGFVGIERLGWSSPQTLGTFLLAAVLLSAFVWIESTVANPLVPLTIFRSRTLTTANIVMLLIEGINGAMILFISLYLQGVKHFSPESTGYAFLPLAAWMVVASNLAPRIVTRFGTRPVMIVGTAITACFPLMLARLDVHSLYLPDILPALFVAGAGMAGAVTAGFIAATSGISDEEQGLASGLIQTSQQVGAALGLAILMAVSSSYNAAAREAGALPVPALAAGYHAAFLGAAVIAGVACLATIFMVPRPHPMRTPILVGAEG